MSELDARRRAMPERLRESMRLGSAALVEALARVRREEPACCLHARGYCLSRRTLGEDT